MPSLKLKGRTSIMANMTFKNNLLKYLDSTSGHT